MLAEYGRDEAKDFAKEHIRGIFSAIPLPETDDHEIDEAGLRHNVRHCLDVIGSAGIYLHGFYGNFWLLTVHERQRALEIVADEVGGRAPIVSRCAHQSLKDTITLVRHADEAGADFISMLPPAFGAKSDEMVFEYFRLVAEETRLGISVFNTPHAGYVMSPELLARIAELSNVVALKNVAPLDHTIAVRELVKDALLVIDPQEENFLINLLHFNQPAIYTYTNYLYDTAPAQPMREYMTAGLNGDAALAATRYYQLQPLRDLNQKWVRRGWQELGQCPVATVKCWVEQIGMRGGAVRPPLPTMSAPQRRELVEDLEASGILGRH